MMETMGFAVYNQPVETCLEYAIAHEIGHLEIHPILEHSQLHTFTPQRIRSIRDFSERTGIQYSIHAPCSLNLSERISFLRKSNVTILKKFIRFAYEIEATHVTCHLGDFHGLVAWPWLRMNLLKRVAQSLEDLLELCDEMQITLAIENAVPLREDGEMHNLGDRYQDFLFLFDQFDSPLLRFCLDCGHANTSEGVLPYIQHVGDRICCMHFHDNHGVHDEHLGVGEGSIEWEEVITSLQAISFSGPYVSECFHVEPHLAIDSLMSYHQSSVL